ncbi:MAG: beta-propeller fold lactonase family protein, partial [Acidobacteria bacterium]|nr:beta-propeller fold lactonase family protein [Acidobacteriota bacterium]
MPFPFPMKYLLAAFSVVAAMGGPSQAPPPRAAGSLVYFGTYTGEHSKGIYVARLDGRTGALTSPELAVETRSPSFLALHPTRDILYAVNEVNEVDGKPGGSVTAFTVDRTTGRLTRINSESSRGGGPAHLVVDQTGRNVLVANYGGGSVA